ncbi:MAG: sialidase family protein [Acidobacteriaceae bacterium]
MCRFDRWTAAALCLCVMAAGKAASQSSATARPAHGVVLVQHVETAGDSAKEPSLAEGPDGTLYVSGFGKLADGQPQQVPRLWKSTDRGATWTCTNIVNAGITGNSDVSLAVARDGAVYLVELEYDPKAGQGVHVIAGVSRDRGVSWRWTTLTRGYFPDRPWVAVAPDGTAHVIWSDGNGVHHVLSRDEGKTWSAPQVVYPAGESSDLAVGPHGEVAVRVTPSFAGGSKYDGRADFIMVSTDGGTTWEKRTPPGYRDWSPSGTEGSIPRWVEPVAWDAEGQLYSLWTNFEGVWLAQSSDAGRTWRQWRIARIDAVSYFPYLTAEGRGELAATWFSGAGEALQWHLARIHVGRGKAQPQVAEVSGLRTDSWTVSDESPSPVRDTAGEYLSVAMLRDGDLAVVSPIQNPATRRLGFSFWRFRESGQRQ